jgi:hypothetical protein
MSHFIEIHTKFNLHDDLIDIWNQPSNPQCVQMCASTDRESSVATTTNLMDDKNIAARSTYIHICFLVNKETK